MSNTRRIVMLITILFLLALPVRRIMTWQAAGWCKGGIFSAYYDYDKRYPDLKDGSRDAGCRRAAHRALTKAEQQALLITVGGIAAWVLLPGKKPETE
ncbi:hypothetical protein IMCC26256_11111 [Actinobacteria bacterium IMCC26256]|nr:hypothetical protein IMCC26256_11111 [Actinobacteria bacterium IMCC26256]